MKIFKVKVEIFPLLVGIALGIADFALFGVKFMKACIESSGGLCSEGYMVSVFFHPFALLMYYPFALFNYLVQFLLTGEITYESEGLINLIWHGPFALLAALQFFVIGYGFAWLIQKTAEKLSKLFRRED